ncbi:hypothetical protein ABFS82_10G098500 [Erythranthe guttata]
MIAIRHFGGPMSFFLLCFSLHRREHFLSHLSLTPRPPLSKLYILHHDSPHADLERRSTRSRRFRRRQPSTLHLLPPTGQLRHRPEIALAHSPLDLHLQEQTNLFELMLPLSIIEMEVKICAYYFQTVPLATTVFLSYSTAVVWPFSPHFPFRLFCKSTVERLELCFLVKQV